MPRYGFNFQWLFQWQPDRQPALPDKRALDFVAQHGFDFIRLPASYWFWIQDFDYFQPDEKILGNCHLQACHERGLPDFLGDSHWAAQ